MRLAMGQLYARSIVSPIKEQHVLVTRRRPERRHGARTGAASPDLRAAQRGVVAQAVVEGGAGVGVDPVSLNTLTMGAHASGTGPRLDGECVGT